MEPMAKFKGLGIHIQTHLNFKTLPFMTDKYSLRMGSRDFDYSDLNGSKERIRQKGW